jgi:spermidine synthase
VAGGAFLLFKAKLEKEAQKKHFILMGLAVLSILGGARLEPLLDIVQVRLEPGEEIVFHREGAVATTTVSRMQGENGDGMRRVFINGLEVSSTSTGAKVPFVWIPTLFHPNPQKGLVVGLGAGEAAYAARDLGLDVTVSELIPEMVEALAINQPKRPPPREAGIRVVPADGRTFILGTEERFDYVLVDISPPIFSQGAVNFYTVDFFELLKSRLTDDGLFALWLPTPAFEDNFWEVAAGFTRVFDHSIAWAIPKSYGAIFLGTKNAEAFRVDEAVLQARIQERLGGQDRILSARGVLELVLADGKALAEFVKDHRPITDDLPSTEFPLMRFLRGEEFHRDNQFVLKLRAFARGTKAESAPR